MVKWEDEDQAPLEMEEENKLQVIVREIPEPMTLKAVQGQVGRIHSIMTDVMIKDEHYGVIPGCGKKPALLKAGAEKLILTFKLVPETVIDTIDMPGFHREYRSVVTLYSVSGVKLGNGCGSCSTMESKYRFRTANKTCPECGKEAIIKGKKEYGGGWLCYKAKGGCGFKWEDGAKVIEDQQTGKIEYDNPADYYNTCMKMSKKRGLVDAVLTVTAASDIFTQDIEEMKDIINPEPKAEPKKEPKDDGKKPPEEPAKITGEQKASIYNFLSALDIENIVSFPKDDPDYCPLVNTLQSAKITSVEDMDLVLAARLEKFLSAKHEEKLQNESK